MPNPSAIWSGQDKLRDKFRSEQAWMRIERDPSTLTLTRETNAKTARQYIEVTVRIEFPATATAMEVGDDGRASRVVPTVFGVYGHPRVPDTDIRRNDTFTLDNHGFRVVNVIKKQGEIQAQTEAIA